MLEQYIANTILDRDAGNGAIAEHGAEVVRNTGPVMPYEVRYGRASDGDHLVPQHLAIGDFVTYLLYQQVGCKQAHHDQLQQRNGKHDALVQCARLEEFHRAARFECGRKSRMFLGMLQLF